MERKEILELKAGRELDALVAEIVFNETKWCPDDPDDPVCRCDLSPPHTVHMRVPLPHFSTDIADAWLVIEKMVKEKIFINLSHGGILWRLNFASRRQYNNLEYDSATGLSVELAICHAGLLAFCQESPAGFTDKRHDN